ncbi:hypothetical protein FOTG_07608 [Fusarium oxysporum f. sp. vasinfectum 25433]|uniref:Uncharacterized protein n=1 Tax=Fusarium oxysporum f. sp. vasinfectum 25433 TaxID=1089449 RepID=X0LXU7_FUSOX|nr:hypothetical protein FOTG_07608 [Fusarium oxysporum f. sp. vasinfectum 25433]
MRTWIMVEVIEQATAVHRNRQGRGSVSPGRLRSGEVRSQVRNLGEIQDSY